MPSRALSLIIDSASEFCNSALFQAYEIRAQQCAHIGKGHAEKLAPQVQEILQEAEISPSMVDQIIVNIGPGSFTGIRVGVAFARALACALQKPAIGVNQLEALAWCTAETQAQTALQSHKGLMPSPNIKEPNIKEPVDKIIVLEKAYRDLFYVQYFDKERNPQDRAHMQHKTQIEEDLSKIEGNLLCIGEDFLHFPHILQQNSVQYAKVKHAPIQNFAYAAYRQKTPNPAMPLYLREADAKPQMGFKIPHMES